MDLDMLRVNWEKYRRNEETLKEWKNVHKHCSRERCRGRRSKDSLAQVVEQGRKRRELGGKDKNVISFIVKEECTKWLEGCYVERMLARCRGKEGPRCEREFYHGMIQLHQSKIFRGEVCFVVRRIRRYC